MKVIKLGILRIVLLALTVGSFITFLQLEEYGLFFASASGFLLAEFLRTFKIFKHE